MAKKLLMGNEAFAHAALEAGVNVVAGYPGTPSSELVETVAKLHAAGAAQDVHVEWSTNEKAALEMLAGASYCGARVLFTCKQVGLNVASDALMSLNYVGTGGGCVLFVADDPGPISSQTEQDTRRFRLLREGAGARSGYARAGLRHDAGRLRAVRSAITTPVIVRPTTRINHASTFFEVAEETHGRPLPEEGFQKDPKWVIFPKRAFEAHGEINRRLAQIAWDYAHDPAFAQFNEVFEGGGEGEGACAQNGVEGAGASAPAVGIVAGGVSAAYAREALTLITSQAARAGIPVPRYRFIAVGTPYPFPTETAAAFAEGLTDVIVFEELDSVLEEEMLKLAGARHLPLRVHGKLTGEANDRGENTTENIAGRLARFFDRTDRSNGLAALVASTIGANDLSYEGPLPVRPPVLCAGCPHRGSFYAVKQALRGREAVLCGDIGCYTLGNAQPLDAVDTCLCMGAGITMAQGFAVAEPDKKQVAFVGDSTFFASAMTGIANAVYNGHDVTFAILDNATTAMTGSQPHPGTGVTLMGERRRPIVIEEVLHGLSFAVQKGEQVTLTGRTGAGKSTIFKLLLGLYRPQQGQVMLNGVEAATLPDTARRPLVGYVEQSFRRVPGTVRDQITLFDAAITPQQAEDAAHTVGLHDAIAALPEGYDTPCTPGIFSQGQWQLLSIARAIAAGPQILLLDEITANLDAGTEQTVLDALQRAGQNRTVVSISHRLYNRTGGRSIEI